MAEIAGELWTYNLAKVVVLDVTDDYRLMQPPLPHDCYPVVAEVWMPRAGLGRNLPQTKLVEGFLYDWHEEPLDEPGDWYVGVVDRSMLSATFGVERFATPV